MNRNEQVSGHDRAPRIGSCSDRRPASSTSPLGQLETFPALSRMSAAGGRADEIRTKAEVAHLGRSPILDAEVAGSGGSVDSSGASRFHAGSFASASPLSRGVRRPAQSALAVAAPPLASPINKPFINAAVATADARTSFIDIPLNQTAVRRGNVSLYQWRFAHIQQFVPRMAASVGTSRICGERVTDIGCGRCGWWRRGFVTRLASLG